MADQLPEAGTAAAVAFNMAKALQHALPSADGDAYIKSWLDLYADCHYAAAGRRTRTSR